MRSPVPNHPRNNAGKTYLFAYEEWLKKQGITGNTLRVYYSRIRQFLLFLEYAFPASEPLADLSNVRERMAFYLDFLKQSKGAARSINANVNALINFSHFLGMDNMHLKRERIYFKPAYVLNLEEQDKFLRSVEQQTFARDRALALVLFYTGLRIGDCTRLNVADVLPNNMLETKTIYDTCARIPLNSPTQLAMRDWLLERAKLVARCTNSDDTAFWLTKSGQRLSISSMSFVLRHIGLQVQVTVSAERLRRTWLSDLNNRLGQK